MSKLNRICLIILAALLVGCQPPISTDPTPTPLVLHMDLTPVTTWLIPTISACAQEIAGINVSVREIETDILDPAKADVLILSGEPDLTGVQAFQIGEVHAIVIVHPSNPLHTIPAEKLAKIFTGQARQWSDVESSMPADEIQVWLPTPGDEVWKVIEHRYFPGESPVRTAKIAPDPLAMLAAVAADANAIGMLPSPYLDQTVSAINDQPVISLPIIAVTHAEASGLTRDFLLCMQERIQ